MFIVVRVRGGGGSRVVVAVVAGVGVVRVRRAVGVCIGRVGRVGRSVAVALPGRVLPVAPHLAVLAAVHGAPTQPAA